MENLQNPETEPWPESKIDATGRLRREGQWEEASAYRHQVRHQLRTEGRNKFEANEGAWRAMIEKFAPLPPSKVPADALDDLLRQCGVEKVDLVADILWVYQHLADKSVAPEQAPGAGAWALLDWSRRNRNKFFDTLLPKALAAKEKRLENSDEELVRRERKSLRELGASLEGFWEECRQSSFNEFGLAE